MPIDEGHARVVCLHVVHDVIRGIRAHMTKIQQDTEPHHFAGHRPPPWRQADIVAVTSSQLSRPSAENVIVSKDHAFVSEVFQRRQLFHVTI